MTATKQMTNAFRWILSAPAFVLVTLVRLYQWLISPLLGRRCRFYPSCSEYFIGAVRKYGAISGSLRGIWRICRCHPFNPGGYDPP
jgi:putative membrane protein insertion efficiency factor